MVDEEEVAQCPICFENFDSERFVPMIFTCGHNICQQCSDRAAQMQQCPVCRKPIGARNRNFQLIDTLKLVENLKLKNQELLNKKLDYKCSLCQKWELEENLVICKTCVIDPNILDLQAVSRNENTTQVLEVSMCSTCAYQMHIKKKHEIVDMFPILSAYQFSNHLSTLEAIRGCFDSSVQECNQTMQNFNETMCGISGEFEKMLELARKSKSTKMQNEVIRKIETEMEQAKLLSLEVTQKIREDSDEMLKLVEKIELEKVADEQFCFEVL
ncbi:unnamed protein product [Caenorhabditis angaria]|uniref:RING-type domain-containing protein n=1 Tax=Caenorhabditis angaria TaxID=860376 RepID=A0A9P1N2A3_9PELO|nr:unnamed protein product [Caenorhabditis angaria]